MGSNRDLVPVTAAQLRDGDRDGHLMVGRRVVGNPQVLADGRVEVLMQWTASRRRERVALDPDRTFRVRRATVGPGLPIRYRGKARTTGRTVEVHDTAHPESAVSAAETHGFRWALRCEHGTVVGRSTLSRAREDADDPRLWCVDCVERPGALLPLPLPR